MGQSFSVSTELASKLPIWLAEAGMTKRQLARHLKVPLRRVAAWCRGTQIAPVRYATRIEQVLGLAPQEAERVLYTDAGHGVDRITPE